jgi:hypothetical protein
LKKGEVNMIFDCSAMVKKKPKSVVAIKTEV